MACFTVKILTWVVMEQEDHPAVPVVGDLQVHSEYFLLVVVALELDVEQLIHYSFQVLVPVMVHWT